MKRPLYLAVAALCLVSLPRLAGSDEELVVSAAASLTNAFSAVGREFERQNPGTRVLCNFAASGALLRQIEQGAPVDVFASADQETMDKGQKEGLILRETRTNFAQNQLVLAVPAGSRTGVRSLQDLTRPDVKRVSLGDPAFVPAGRYARQSLVSARLWDALQPKLVPGNNVRQVLDYLSRGEVDAGFIFASDAVVAKGKVRVVAEVGGHSPALYPIAVVAGTGKKALAQRFIEFVRSPAGTAILKRFGFGAP